MTILNLATPPPDKLSDLIELAIADARKLDRYDYAPTWMTWHRRNPADGKCMVCLAGAVIAGTLGCARETIIDIAAEDSADPRSTTITDEPWRRALRALDSAREGHWNEAFENLRGSYPADELRNALDALPRPRHREFNAWNQFDAHLASLADCASKLREIGL
ncbi:MAG: hypothetical protein OXQ28_05195 [Acidobacteriota bacterium]|nr:hypothetical protein [Acidobacteriota bacterium]